MKQKQRPLAAENLQPWQIAQAAKCGCRGTDEYCPCQNADEPWKYGLGPPPIVPFSGLITMLSQMSTRAEGKWTEADYAAFDRAIVWAREVMG